MSTQIPFNADGIQTPSSIVAETFNFTDGEAVSLRPFLREVDGVLVATTGLSMASDIPGFVSTAESGGDYDMWFNAATGDIAGNLYVVGDDDDDGRAMVYAFNSVGALLWKVTMDQVGGSNPESYAINFANDQVTIGFRYYDGTSNQVGTLTLNAADGTVVNSVLLTSPENASPRINAMATKANGDQVIVGEIYGEFATVTNLTAQPLSGPGVLWLNDSDLPTPTDNGQWEIDVNGTWQGVYSKNELNSVPTETVTGSGTGMTIFIRWSSRDDSYSYYNINGYGSGYNVPDRIRVRGSLLGGIDNTDITATATSSSDVDGNTVAVYDKATYPTMGSIGAGWHIIFPNGLTYDVVSVTDNGTTWSVAVTSNGVDFSGPGMYTGGGNDFFLYITLDYWGGQSVQQLFQVPTAGKSRFEISDQNDFSTGGPYSVRYGLDAQAYIWTPNWQHTYGDAEFQSFRDVAVSTSDDIYLLGNFSKEINNTWYNTLVTKLDTNGDLQWSKYVADSTEPGGSTGSVCVDLGGNVFVIGTNGADYTVITKLDSAGDVIWQVRQTNNNNWDNEPRAAIDTTGNIYLSGRWDNGDYDVISVMKIDGSNGSLLWARQLGNTEEYNMREFYDDECQPMKIAGDSIYYCGYVYDINDDQYVGFATRLSTEGNGTGTFGRWVYSEDAETEFETSTSDAEIIDSGYSPTDIVTQSISGNSASVSIRNIGQEFETREVFSNGGSGITGVDSITFGDGTVQTTAPPPLGNYSFNGEYFNIPPNAIFNGQSNGLTMDLNQITYNIGEGVTYNVGYNMSYNVNNQFNVYANAARIQASNNLLLNGDNQVRVNMNGREIWFMNYGDKPGMLWSSYVTGSAYNNVIQLGAAMAPKTAEDSFLIQTAPYIGREYCKFVSPKISYTPMAGTTVHTNYSVDFYDSGTTIIGDDENAEMNFSLFTETNPNFHAKFINMSKTQNMIITGWSGSIWIKSGSKTELTSYPTLVIPPRTHAEFQRFAESDSYYVTGDYNDQCITTVSGTNTAVLTFSNELQHITVTSDITFSWAIPNYLESWSTSIVLTVQNSAIITWPTETAWPGGTPPTITDGVHMFEAKYIKGPLIAGMAKIFMVPHLNYA